MARLNIEDSLFKDGRFTELALAFGSRHMAIGAVVDLFLVAQEFYLKQPNRMIPMRDFELRKCSMKAIEAGFGEIVDSNFVYVYGSKEQFSWLLQKQEAGSSVTEKKIDSLKRAREAKKLKYEANRLNGACTESERSLYASEPLTPTLSSFLFPLSSDSSLLLELYQDYPLKKGKSKGLQKLAKDLKNEADIKNFKIARDKYKAEVTDITYCKHFSTFCNEWRDWVDFVPTNKPKNNPPPKAQKVFDHAKDQLDRIDQGLL